MALFVTIPLAVGMRPLAARYTTGSAMAEDKKGGYCDNCEKSVVVFRKGTNHILHLLMSVVTAGFWLIIWVLSAIKFGGWRCTECGSTRVSKIR